MRFDKLAATGILAATAIAATAGTATAAPALPRHPGIDYQATVIDQSAVIRTDAGSMTADNGIFTINAPDGRAVAGIPLEFRVDDFAFPIQAEIHDRTATLTPRFDRAHAVYKPVDLPVRPVSRWKTREDREQAAWDRMNSTIGLGATIGTLVGGIGGGAVGCVLGGLAVGAGATLATGIIGGLFSFLPGAVVGCLAGAAALGALGTLAGQIFITAPFTIAAVAQYFSTINEPFSPE
ncbi:hypothetical protein [Nocardia terpenica]|uniref:DUF8020 domain-containing protein n=1 Tax=Nocardia terpenica TaxID=455432 RepID=A0A161XEF1_9NOCA|nr:hypothetical protein [Nocardia terpenica]KZM71738.1 hypothetical protein AWN90_03245 [Nocardia terpenica]NQE90989.1 hypothetical protein [Nocardia terpenica]